MGEERGNGSSRSRDSLIHGVAEFLAKVSDCTSLEVLEVSPLAGGAVQENHRVDVVFADGVHQGRHELVLRLDAPTRIAASLARTEEFQVMRAAWEVGAAVPEPLWECRDPAVIGREFFLMRRLPGVAAGHRLVRDPELDPIRERLVERLGRELALIHRIRPPHPELEFLPEPDFSPALDRVAELRGYLDGLPGPQPTIEWGLRWLERRARPSPEVVLCHGDYRTGNYLVDEGEISGVLDWEFARWGDPLEDIGWFCARCWRAGRFDREAGGMASREVFYRGYEREAGVEIDRDGVAYWETMATARWAILALQQGQRYLSEVPEPAHPGGSIELALTARMVPEMEMDILMQLDTHR